MIPPRLIQFSRRWVPPAARQWFNRVAGYAITYTGPYATWAEANAIATGYNDSALLNHLAEAAQESRAQPGTWERDGVVRDKIPPDFPLFYAMLTAAEKGKVRVLDIGGGMGASYQQCRHYMPAIDFDWRIVEQQQLVSAGRKLDYMPRYYNSVDEAIRGTRPDICLMSGVLQYLPDPYGMLRAICDASIPYLVLDRHPFSFTEELIAVQVVPKSIYPSSYPSWLFGRSTFLSALDKHFRLLAEWRGNDPAIAGNGIGAQFFGLFFTRK